jgi:hypothetical protein
MKISTTIVLDKTYEHFKKKESVFEYEPFDDDPQSEIETETSEEVDTEVDVEY